MFVINCAVRLIVFHCSCQLFLKIYLSIMYNYILLWSLVTDLTISFSFNLLHQLPTYSTSHTPTTILSFLPTYFSNLLPTYYLLPTTYYLLPKLYLLPTCYLLLPILQPWCNKAETPCVWPWACVPLVFSGRRAWSPPLRRRSPPYK